MVDMEHFILRTEALIVDGIIVTLLTALLNNILFMLFVLLHIPVLNFYNMAILIVVTMAYFTIFEAKTNKTIGKKMLHLYVSDDEGYMSYKKAFIRNITKICWVPLIVDIIIGKLLNYPSRLFDKIAQTDVYADNELESVEEDDDFEALDDDFEELEAEADFESKDEEKTAN